MIEYYLVTKRLLDVLLSALAILILWPLFYLIIVFVKLDSIGTVFYRQKRIGKDFRPFQLVKFRSMCVSENPGQREFDPGDKSRVTRVGLFLRKTKLDELPELFNVLKGDMSIVGPRPEVSKYVHSSPEDFKTILKIRPGLSDYASIKYRSEEAILAAKGDPEHYYVHTILPDKLRLARRYAKEVSLGTDLRIIGDTIRSIIPKST